MRRRARLVARAARWTWRAWQRRYDPYVRKVAWRDWKRALAPPARLVNFLHPDRPAWTWMPTLTGPLRPLWPLYKRWAWWRERREDRQQRETIFKGRNVGPSTTMGLFPEEVARKFAPTLAEDRGTCGEPSPSGRACQHPPLHRGCCETWTDGSEFKADERWWPKR